MTNIRLTANFTIDEFKCHDGTGVPWDLVDHVQELAENLQLIRDHIGAPLRITSGYRNPTYNKQVGGENGSYHCKGMAADITCPIKTPKELHKIIEGLISKRVIVQGGLGLYSGFVHYDIRGTKARW